MKTLYLTLALSLILGTASAQQPLLTLDEDVWVTFYDLPSRRFRNMRDAFLRRDFASVERDMEVASGFIRIEATRAASPLKSPLEEQAASLDGLRARLAEPSVSVERLDAVFARTHWLLAQNYLVAAMTSRDQGEHRTAGLNLQATAHHLERAVLWSNARIRRSTLNSLQSIRDMAGRLQESKRPERIYREEPLILTAKTLKGVGKHLDRNVHIEKLLPE